MLSGKERFFGQKSDGLEGLGKSIKLIGQYGGILAIPKDVLDREGFKRVAVRNGWKLVNLSLLPQGKGNKTP